MTRINSAISVRCLTDEHLLAEHREIKRLPDCFVKSYISGALKRIPNKFCLGTGHVTFFLNKAQFTLDRYKQIHEECIRRGFNVPDYSENWKQVIMKDYWKSYEPTKEEQELLINRITERIRGSSKTFFHYEGKAITKVEAIEILTNKSIMSKTLTEAMPEIEEIAKELGIKVNNYKVLEEYRRRHPEEFKEKEDNNGKEI